MSPAKRIAIIWRAIARAVSAELADEAQRLALGNVRFGSRVLIRGADRITVGTGVFIDHCAYLNPGTVNQRRGFIRIGDAVEIGPYSVLWGGGGIEIGDSVHLGAHVHLTSQQGRFQPSLTGTHTPLQIDCAPIRIGDHALIYSGAIVTPGVSIGHHAVVAAGAVVVDDIPPYAIAAGVPARLLERSVVAGIS
ncbi:MAG: DapH/DapD/GlmU-related protein [Candidatus Baltobacteraceae bacterium]